ncbi:COQ9 family protein [Novosphingobium cyanobacteriorum]|uniref:COQ9 family protein n=1 Tax=Novosphingobium cyanobacteriorum TaxID=3024215 RepID=A0ABT6CMQ7_9SPHN|nr:COQ9 family protein [Novosphingobium cyanobacteriorum]MDF8334518.1 COQ9 family protein [Novosphingobium cyanobacteriorum]
MMDDLTMDELRLDLAPLVAESAVFDGWSDAAVTAAAEIAGVDPAAARFAFQNRPMTMIAAWIGSIDRAMAQDLPAERIGNLPIRERIRTLVQFRLDALAGKEEALRRALIEMARPRNLAETARLSWRSADRMWRLAGDVATDYNHYTKRATLAAIYAATLAAYAEDQSEDHAETRAFLDRRIENVMQFEKAKARVMKPRDETFSVMRLLGRLRYPAS